MMGHREILKGGDEFDFLTKSKKYYYCPAGRRRAIKAKFNRRVRKVQIDINCDNDLDDFIYYDIMGLYD